MKDKEHKKHKDEAPAGSDAQDDKKNTDDKKDPPTVCQGKPENQGQKEGPTDHVQRFRIGTDESQQQASSSSSSWVVVGKNDDDDVWCEIPSDHDGSFLP